MGHLLLKRPMKDEERVTTHMRAGGEETHMQNTERRCGKSVRQARAGRFCRPGKCGLRKDFLTPSRKNPKTPSYFRLHLSGS